MRYMTTWKRSLKQVKQNKVFSLLGLATRSGNLVSGEFSTENAVRDGSAALVLVAVDASDNTKKLFSDKCSYYNIPEFVYGTKEEIGHAIGKEFRASVAVLDDGFAKAIRKNLEETVE